jgi:XTP/dITP diphosphohydrolase
MELVIATYNPGKFAELQAGLEIPGISLLSLKDFPHIPEAPETGETFSEIARNKAQYYFEKWSAGFSRHNGPPASAGILAEDSGLVIPSLNGFPGIFSARIGKTDDERIRIVLEKLHSASDRSAYYHCSMVFITTAGKIETEGRCYGTVAETSRGNLGFGYDPVFVPQNSNRTFGETPLSEKATISHRGKALQEMIPRIRKNWNL